MDSESQLITKSSQNISHKPQDQVSHRKFEVLVLSENTTQVVMMTQLYLRLDCFGLSNMVELDRSLKELQIKRSAIRMYWKNGLENLMPIFNYITLSCALTLMADENNYLYIVKKEREAEVFEEESLFMVDPVDENLILRMSSEINKTINPCFTRFEETSYNSLITAAKGEHVPSTWLLPKPEKSSSKQTDKSQVSDKKKAKTK